MKSIVFSSVPLGARKYFKIKLGRKSPELDIQTANQCIKNFAQTLSNKKGKKISFKLIDSNKEPIYEAENVDVVSEDAQDGLIGILGRIILEKPGSEDALLAKEYVMSAVSGNVQENADPTNDSEDETSSTMSSNDLWSDENDENEKEIENDNDNQTSTGALGAPAQEETDPFEIPEFEAPEDPGEKNSLDDPNLADNEKEQGTSLSLKESEQDTLASSQPKMLTLDDYLALEDVDQKLEKFSSSSFDVNETLKDLGYVEEPKDKYEREANTAILTALDKNDLLSIKIGYENEQVIASQTLKKSLSEAYDSVTSTSITEAAEAAAAEKLEQLENYSVADQDQANEQVNIEEDSFKKHQKERRDLKLRQYQEQLEEADEVEFNEYSSKLRTDNRNKIEHLQRTLAQDTEKVRRNSKNDVINKRNTILLDKKVSLTGKTEEDVINKYRQSREQYQLQLSKFRKDVLKDIKEIEAQRQLDEKAEWDRKIKKQELAEQKRTNDLLEHQNRLQMKQALQERNSQKDILKTLYKFTHDGKGNKQKPAELKDNAPIQEATETSKSVQPETKWGAVEVYNKHKVENTGNALYRTEPVKFGIWKILGVIGVVMGLGGAGYYVYSSQSKPSETTITKSEKAAPRATEDKTVNNDKEKSSDAQMKKGISKKQSSTKKRQKTLVNGNLDKYVAAKTWAQKVDVLNGALGQHDDRALKQINDHYATHISQLYEYITLQNDAGIRKVWTSMSAPERHEVSRDARNAVVLAFYNVSDWAAAWNAKEGING